MSGSQVTIIEPNGVKRTRPLTSRGLTIGRGEDNDLIIAYAAVSRNHAQIAFDQGRYYVTDLNSANGTYLSNRRLEPSIPTVWVPGQPLRIGDVLIYLEQTASVGHKIDAGARTNAEPIPRTKVDTIVGPLPKEDQLGRKGKSRPLVRILIVLVALLALVALCAVAYYFLL